MCNMIMENVCTIVTMGVGKDIHYEGIINYETSPVNTSTLYTAVYTN